VEGGGGGGFQGRVRGGRAVGGEDAGPEVERVRVLPVVDCFVGVLCRVRDAGSKVDGQLTDVAEAGRVADVRVEAPEFGGGVLHQVDAWEGVDVCDAAALDEALVDGLEDCFAEGGVADDGEASDDEKGGYSCGFVACGLRPDIDRCLDQVPEYLLER